MIGRVKRQRASLFAIVLAASGAACGLLPLPRAPAECGFPDGTALAFAGRASLNQLGLSGGAPTDDAPAMVYVTAEPVPFNGSVPAGGQAPPDQPLYCALYDDGVRAWGSIPADWSPPT